MKIDPQTVHVSVPNPDDQFLPPIYEGPANQAHEKITTGQYRALIDDPYTDEPIEVMLHVWTAKRCTTNASAVGTRGHV